MLSNKDAIATIAVKDIDTRRKILQKERSAGKSRSRAATEGISYQSGNSRRSLFIVPNLPERTDSAALTIKVGSEA